MRTTLTIDDELEQLLRREMLRSGKSFKSVVNDALRAALVDNTRVPAPFRQRSFDLGGSALDLTKALALAAEIEDQERAGKLARGQ